MQKKKVYLLANRFTLPGLIESDRQAEKSVYKKMPFAYDAN
jgi:hypothetical protein